MDEFQRKTTALAAQAWPDDEPSPELADSLIARLAEETGELARAVRKLWRRRFGHPDEAQGTRDEVLDELGDVLFLTARIATLCSVSLEEAAWRVVGKIERRIAGAAD